MNVREFLRNRDITFEALDHPPTYSAQSLAATVHMSGDEVAKTVLLWTEGDYFLAVLPASRTIDFEKVRDVLGGDDIVELASERECGERFSDCELGSLPPFGSQYGMKTVVDESLLRDEMIVFEGNSHDDAVRMQCRKYIELERPIIGDFTEPF